MRHAKAGSRSSWDGPDEQRPLSKAGRRQAKALGKALRDEPIFRVVSSPYVRCIETVEPVAELRSLPVEEADELAEETPVSDVLRLIEKVADKPTVLCTHGDVVENLLTYVRDRRVPPDGEFAFPKGSTWVLDVDDGEIVRSRYLPPKA